MVLESRDMLIGIDWHKASSECMQGINRTCSAARGMQLSSDLCKPALLCKCVHHYVVCDDTCADLAVTHVL